MSRIACPYDNAQAESFIKTLKQEEVDGRSYRDLAYAEAEIGNFIEQIYNTKKLHSALDYQSPVEFEEACIDATTQSIVTENCHDFSVSRQKCSPG